MKISMYDFVIDKLHVSRGSWPSIAISAGMSKRTVEKIARKEIENPSVHNVQKLYDYFVGAKKKQA